MSDGPAIPNDSWNSLQARMVGAQGRAALASLPSSLPTYTPPAPPPPPPAPAPVVAPPAAPSAPAGPLDGLGSAIGGAVSDAGNAIGQGFSDLGGKVNAAVTSLPKPPTVDDLLTGAGMAPLSDTERAALPPGIGTAVKPTTLPGPPKPPTIQDLLQGIVPDDQMPPTGAQSPDKLYGPARAGILAFGRSQVGLPYGLDSARNAQAPDCSLFVSEAYAQAGIKVTPFTDAAANEMVPVSQQDAKPGDTIFYKYSDPSQPGVTYPHMGIYLGNGQMLDSQYGKGVGVHPMLNVPYEIKRPPALDQPQTQATAATGATSSSTPSGPTGAWADKARAAAQAAGIDPEIFARQMQQESGYDPDVIYGTRTSSAGAQGIAQFMPATAKGLGIDPLDPNQALPAAANMMASYVKQYGGDYAKALAAYNAGPGNVEKYGGVPPFEETQRYVNTILGDAARSPAGSAIGGAASAIGSGAQAAASTAGSAVQHGWEGVQSMIDALGTAKDTSQATAANRLAVPAHVTQAVARAVAQDAGNEAGRATGLLKLGVDAYMGNPVTAASIRASDPTGGTLLPAVQGALPLAQTLEANRLEQVYANNPFKDSPVPVAAGAWDLVVGSLTDPATYATGGLIGGGAEAITSTIVSKLTASGLPQAAAEQLAPKLAPQFVRALGWMVNKAGGPEQLASMALREPLVGAGWGATQGVEQPGATPSSVAAVAGQGAATQLGLGVGGKVLGSVMAAGHRFPSEIESDIPAPPPAPPAPEPAPVLPRQTNPEIASWARDYTDQAGLPAPVGHPYVKNDVPTQQAAAQYHEQAVSDPTNPATRTAYTALASEVHDQFTHATDQGMTFEPYHGPDPYTSSADMARDVAQNHHLWVYADSLDHPSLTDQQNWEFRAVHDLYGHAMEGYQFGPRGEENAWLSHMQMFSPEAQKAMTTETRMQNSVVNYGSNAAANKANPANTTYAEQKSYLPPPQFMQHPDVPSTRPAQVSWETSLGGSAPDNGYRGAPPDQKLAHDTAVSQAIIDAQVPQKLGLQQVQQVHAPGIWHGQASAGVQTLVHVRTDPLTGDVLPEDAAKLDSLAAIIGIHANKQDAVGVTALREPATAQDANAVDLNVGRVLTPAEAIALDQGLAKASGNPDGHAIIATKQGAVVLNIGDQTQAGFQNAVHAVASGALPDAIATPVQASSHLVENDWSTNPHGESYLATIQRGGHGAIYDELRDSLTRNVSEAQTRIAQTYGWRPTGGGADAAPIDGATGAGGSGTGRTLPAEPLALPAGRQPLIMPPTATRAPGGGFLHLDGTPYTQDEIAQHVQQTGLYPDRSPAPAGITNPENDPLQKYVEITRNGDISRVARKAPYVPSTPVPDDEMQAMIDTQKVQKTRASRERQNEKLAADGKPTLPPIPLTDAEKAGGQVIQREVPFYTSKGGQQVGTVNYWRFSDGQERAMPPGDPGTAGSKNVAAYQQAINDAGGKNGFPIARYKLADGSTVQVQSPGEYATAHMLAALQNGAPAKGVGLGGKVQQFWSLADAPENVKAKFAGIPYINVSPWAGSVDRAYFPDWVAQVKDAQGQQRYVVLETKDAKALGLQEEQRPAKASRGDLGVTWEGNAGGGTTLPGWHAAKKSIGAIVDLAQQGTLYHVVTPAESMQYAPAGESAIKRVMGLPGVDQADKPYLATKALEGKVPDAVQNVVDTINRTSQGAVDLWDKLSADSSLSPDQRVQQLTRYVRDQVLPTGDALRDFGTVRTQTGQASVKLPGGVPTGRLDPAEIEQSLAALPDIARTLLTAKDRGVLVKALNIIHTDTNTGPVAHMHATLSGDHAGIDAITTELGMHPDATQASSYTLDRYGNTATAPVTVHGADSLVQQAFAGLHEMLTAEAPRIAAEYHDDGTATLRLIGRNAAGDQMSPELLHTWAGKALKALDAYGYKGDLTPQERVNYHDYQQGAGYAATNQLSRRILGEAPVGSAERDANSAGSAGSPGGTPQGSAGQAPALEGANPPAPSGATPKQGGSIDPGFAAHLGGAAAGAIAGYATAPSDATQQERLERAAVGAGMGLGVAHIASSVIDARSGGFDLQKLADLRDQYTSSQPPLMPGVAKANPVDQAIALTVNSMLSGVGTMTTQVVGHMGMTLARPAMELSTGHGVDAARDVMAMGGALGQAFAQAGTSLKTGAVDHGSGSAPGQGLDTRAFVPGRSIPDTLGFLLTPQSRVLAAKYEFFRVLNSAGAQAAEASKIMRQNPGMAFDDVISAHQKQILDAGTKGAAEANFVSGGGMLAELGGQIAKWRGELLHAPTVPQKALGLTLQAILPFTKVPGVIMDMGIRGLPGVNEVTGGISAARKLAAGDAEGAQSELGKTALLAATSLAILSQVAQGNITGDGPSNVAEKLTKEAAVDADGNHVWEPNSIRLPGGRWVSHAGLGPIGINMAVIANAFEAAHDPSQSQAPLDLATTSLARTAQTITSAWYLKGLSDTLAAISSGTTGMSKVGRTVESMGDRLVPQGTLLNEIRNLTDPTVRDPQNVLQREQNRIPGLSSGAGGLLPAVPPAIEPTTGLAQQKPQDVLSVMTKGAPPRVSTPNPVAMELARLQAAGHNVGISAENASYSGATQDPAQLGLLRSTMGQAKNLYVTHMLADPKYQALPDAEKAKTLQATLRQAASVADLNLGSDVARSPQTAALQAWSQVPQYYGVSGTGKEVAQQNFAIAQAKASLAAYQADAKAKTGNPYDGEKQFRQDDPSAYKLSQAEPKDSYTLDKLKKQLDQQFGGALLQAGNAGLVGAGSTVVTAWPS